MKIRMSRRRQAFSHQSSVSFGGMSSVLSDSVGPALRKSGSEMVSDTQKRPLSVLSLSKMKKNMDTPIFFTRPAAFRAWLQKHHRTTTGQWIGFHRKSSGRPSITWPEAVDEALCFGWIDGLRKSIDRGSYKIRFTPRRARSNWSAINIAKMKELVRAGRVRPAGIKAFQRRSPAKSRVYSYENRKSAKLSGPATKLFRAESAAWKFFQQQPASYRQTAAWWVSSAKGPETQRIRLQKLIASSSAGRRLW